LERDTDGRVDVYALGVILYEMLCARVPHRGDSMVRTLAMQMLDPIEPPSKVRPDLAIAPELEAIVMHASPRSASSAARRWASCSRRSRRSCRRRSA